MAQNICISSSHPDRDSLLVDIYFCLGAIAMDPSDFNNSRIYKEKSLDLVMNICQELDVADERLYLAYASEESLELKIDDTMKEKPTSKKHCEYEKRWVITFPGRGKSTLVGPFWLKASLKSATRFFLIA